MSKKTTNIDRYVCFICHEKIVSKPKRGTTIRSAPVCISCQEEVKNTSWAELKDNNLKVNEMPNTKIGRITIMKMAEVFRW